MSPLTAPQVIDLFAGAGGFSLGFEQAGFKVHTAIEADAWACETLRTNHPHCQVMQRDITTISDEEIISLFGKVGLTGIIGGPPCQGFSHSNITKRDPRDPRNSLFREFARFVKLLSPLFFVLENVPGLLKTKLATGDAAISVIRDEFESVGYSVCYTTLKAQSFGVPQIRERLFVLGARKLKFVHPFPLPTHHSGAPDQDNLFQDRSLLPLVPLWDAISDLPPLNAGEGEDPCHYVRPPETDYQLKMRGKSDRLWNHVAMNHSKRIIERFKCIAIGESQSDVGDAHAPRVRNNGNKVSEKRYDQNNRRLDPHRPSHTIPASFYANFVHPFQHRNFTPREGARLQSFPDAYVFKGKPTVVSQKLLSREGRVDEKHLCQYVQIGNAVPPRLACAIGKNLLRQI